MEKHIKDGSLPTAEQFLIEAGFPGHAKHGLAKKWMIEFAKLHVEAALKAASKKSKNKEGQITDHKLTNSILNSYPLSNIK